MSAAGPVPYLVLAGDPEEIGLAHGAALGPRLRNFISDGRARLDYLMTPPGDLDVVLDAYGAAITEQVPELTAEINGLARDRPPRRYFAEAAG